MSHALLGAAAAYAFARTRNRLTLATGAVGALLPDVDVLIGSSSDPLLALEYHRHFTHSFFAAPFGALIVAGLMWLALRRKAELVPLFWSALAGYISAILLDACTSYGTQLLWPFSDRRFSASIVAVIDPVVTIVLAAGVIAALRSAAARPAQIAIGIVALYLGCGWLQRERAEGLVERMALARGHTISQHEVKPTLGNLLLWRSVYLSGKDYRVDAVRVGLFSAPVLYPGGAARRVEPIDLVPPLTINSVQAADAVRFAKVSEGYLARDPGRPNVIGDVRYSILPNSTLPLWAIEVMPEREDQHVTFHNYREFTKQDRERFFAMLRGVAPGSLVAPEPKSVKQDYKGRGKTSK
ncbi:MAG TPA: metal-dependent hydrolase [Burkholderiales bacterium]|nr:metal-dependent hydrolase [Burkholderiales bacterium]